MFFAARIFEFELLLLVLCCAYRIVAFRICFTRAIRNFFLIRLDIFLIKLFGLFFIIVVT